MPSWRLLLLLLAAGAGGCGSSPTTAEPEPDPLGCPDPGAGIRVGGRGGAGADVAATPVPRLVLMGGGPENDAASLRFVEAAGGGDVVILRATGSLTSYPEYFTRTLAPEPAPATAVTVLTARPAEADDAAVLCLLERSEAVWLAGGDQWDYLGGWPDTVHAALAAVVARGGAIGGTSAGAVVLGEAAFSARAGTITSGEALADPWAPAVSLSYPAFAHPALRGVLVDSHFQDRGREGRLLAFLARFAHERGYASVLGVGLDEGVALSIEGGRYSVESNGRGAAWVYAVEAPAALPVGSPLRLDSVRRVRLGRGSSGAWPLHVDAADAQRLHVTDGVVRLGAPG